MTIDGVPRSDRDGPKIDADVLRKKVINQTRLRRAQPVYQGQCVQKRAAKTLSGGKSRPLEDGVRYAG